MDATETSANVLDLTNVMTGMVDKHAINHPELTFNQVWIHIKETLDAKSNDSRIGKNDTEATNRAKCVRHDVLGEDLFRMIDQYHAGKMKDNIFYFCDST